MNADLRGCLANLSKSYKIFSHRGKNISKDNVKKILEYGIKQGYNSTAELSDIEIDNLLRQ